MQQVLCPVLVGRDEELAVLRAGLEAARGGGGGCVLLAGEAGIGKSRLVREAAAEARASGAVVLTGRGATHGGATAFRPLTEALLSALRTAGPPDAPELEGLRPALARVVPAWGAPTAGDNRAAGPERDAEGPIAEGPSAPPEPWVPADLGRDSPVMVGEAILRLLGVLGAGRGCLLALEDLHWADADTLAVLEYLVDNLDGEPVLCVGTLRPEPAGAQGWAAALAARRVATLVELDALGGAEVERMGVACLGAAALPDAVSRLLRDDSDGIPFLVEELLAGAVGAGALVRSGDGWVAGALPGARVVPRTFAETVRRRLGGLPEPARRVLEMAAVLGRRFDWRLAAAATGMEQELVLDALRAATRVQLVTDDVEGFRFRHALTRDAILGDLLAAERAERSRQALTAVLADARGTAMVAGRRELAARLAEGAGEHHHAGLLHLQVGEEALGRGALASAETALTRAAELLPDHPALLVEVEDRLTETLARAGKTERTFTVGAGLLEHLGALGAPGARRARVHLRLARAAAGAGQLVAATGHLDRARDTGGGADRARADALAAHVAWERGDADGAAELARAALDAARAEGLPEVVCEALEVLGRCARVRDTAAAGGLFEQALATAHAHGLAFWRIRALQELGTLEVLDVGPLERLPQARQLALDAGALALVALVDLQLAAALHGRNRLEEMLVAAERSLRAARRLQLAGLLPMATALRGVALVLLGRGEEAEAPAEQAIASGDVGATAIAWGDVRATWSLLSEDRPRARRELDVAMSFARLSPTAVPAPFRGMWALVRAVEGDDGGAAVAEVRGSIAATNEINRDLLGFAEAVVLGREGKAAEAAARLAASSMETADDHWHRALCLRLSAEAALEDGWGEPVAWLREALATFEARGVEAPAAACRALLRRAGAPPPRALRRDAALPVELRALGVTVREAEVLQLVAQGLGNKEIAGRLYLSPRTIETHVANLVAKTGVASRTELIAWAARQQR